MYKAPFIVRILVAELGQKPEKDALLTINYDGTFDETTGRAVLAATSAVQAKMLAYLKEQQPATLSLEQALDLALRAWAVGSLATSRCRRKRSSGAWRTRRTGRARAARSPPRARLS